MATVRNGLAMCPTHHRAYDQDVLLVSESYCVEIERGRLEHVESPPTVKMVLDYDGKTICLPKDERLRPAAEFLKRKGTVAA
jgi:putative restriction endonuclease